MHNVTYFILGEAEKLFSWSKKLDSYHPGWVTPQDANRPRDDEGVPETNFVVDASSC